MARKNKSELYDELATNITDNTNNENTAQRVREIIFDIIESTNNLSQNSVQNVVAGFQLKDETLASSVKWNGANLELGGNIKINSLVPGGSARQTMLVTPAGFMARAERPYYYKVLLSQGPPTTETSGLLILARYYTLTTYVAGDDFSNQTLISGTGNTTGDVYLATSAMPTDWSNGSQLDYFGEPYVVSMDSGETTYQPLVDDLSGIVAFEYVSAGTFKVKDTTNLYFKKSRTMISFGELDSVADVRINVNKDNMPDYFTITTTDTLIATNSILNNTEMTIFVYP